jgi:hypothetical protein
MTLLNKLLAVAVLGTSCGCVYRARVDVPVPAEPVPAGYVYYDRDPYYYDRGWYDGPYWHWYGRDGREFHERREEREHHFRERHEHEFHEHEFRH